MTKIEIVGNQLRFNTNSKDNFTPDSMKNIDVGTPGKLQMTIGMNSKNPNRFEIHTIRMNLSRFSSIDEVNNSIDGLILRKHISKRDGIRSKRMVSQWWKKNK